MTKDGRRAQARRNDEALLEAARAVLARDGAHASVAAIADAASVGIGTLYRRYRTKEELFQRLATMSVDHWIEAAEAGLAHADPWAGLVHFVTSCIEFGHGALAPIAGTIEVTADMADKSRRGDELLVDLVRRGHDAGLLRTDVTAVDISLLVEQLGRSPLLDQVRKQGREDLVAAAIRARRRIVALALDGLRPGPHAAPLPGRPPSMTLFHARWERSSTNLRK